MAPRVGLEPTAYRLTAGCSTIELPWNIYKEATSRFELEIKELQSTALPLGYVAMKNQIMGWIKRFELSVSRATIWRFNQLSYTHHILVEVKGLEPPAPWSQTTCATKLRYTPTSLIKYNSIQKFMQVFFLIFFKFLSKLIGYE